MCILSGCLTSPPVPPVPAPPVPRELAVLPREGQTSCIEKGQRDKDLIAVWEFPGTAPPDPESAPKGYRGAVVGYVTECQSVRVTDVSWSQWDGQFWVYIVAPQVNGWITWVFLDPGSLQESP